VRAPVCFFLAAEPDLAALRRLDPEADWRELVRGERAWVLQTFLRLARAGHPVELAGALPEDGIVVFHAKHKREVARLARRRPRLALVAARAELRPVDAADFEVLQNGLSADGRRHHHLAHWPQAGLVPRDPARGTAIRRAGFKGFAGNLHSALRSPEWCRFLARHDVEWEVDAVPFAGRHTDPSALSWNDYSRLDLVVALRPPSEDLHPTKPATKLLNAWLAGVPAVLGPEHAYRELRRSPLDFLEAATLAEAEAAVERLAADPGLYRAMVDNGRERAPEFSFAATTARWAELLFEVLPPLAAEATARRLRRLPLPLRSAGRRLARLLAGRRQP
jgi:hypothetical protein